MINEHSSINELLRALQTGQTYEQEDAWIYLYARCMAPLIRYAAQALPYQDAEEVANETLEQVFLSIDQYDGSRNGQKWLWAIHKHKVIDRLRRNGKVEFVALFESLSCPDSYSCPEFHFMRWERWQVFLRAWSSLPQWAQIELRPDRRGRKGKEWERAKRMLQMKMMIEESNTELKRDIGKFADPYGWRGGAW